MEIDFLFKPAVFIIHITIGLPPQECRLRFKNCTANTEIRERVLLECNGLFICKSNQSLTPHMESDAQQ